MPWPPCLACIIPRMRRFFVVFILVQLVLFGIELTQPVQQHVVLPVTAALARVCAWVIGLFDPSVVSYGKVLMHPKNGFAVSVEPGCNGIEAFIVLTAAIIAFPSPWKHRLWGLLIGFFAVQVLNVIRVICLFYLGQHNMVWFNFAHEYLWQAFIMFDVLVVFLLWAKRVPRQPEDSPPSPPSQGNMPTPAVA